MTADIVGKAGVLEFDSEQDLSGDQVFNSPGAWADPVAFDQHRDCIIKFTMPSLDASEEVGTAFRLDAATAFTEGYAVTINADNDLNFYKYDAGWVLQQSYPLPVSGVGMEVTMSAWTSHFGVWLNGRFVHTFVDTTYTAGDYAGPIAYGVVTVTVDLSACDRRVDNFILDMGQRGSQLIRGLMGTQRLTVLDTPTGGMRMARLKFGADPIAFDVPDLIIEEQENLTDVDLVSLVRAEGYNAIEVADFETMAERGYLFQVYNAREANDDWETRQEALAVLEMAKSSSHELRGTAAADPRVEPNDVIGVTLPLGVDIGAIIVDSAVFSVRVNYDGAGFDMQVDGRASDIYYAPSVVSILPVSGPEAGGTAVAITGQYFRTGALVYFDAAPATGIVIASAESITCVTPAGTGAVDVKVVNPDLQEDSLVGGFTYV